MLNKKKTLETYPNGIPKRKIGFYEKHIKRVLDIISASLAIGVFGWLYALLAILVKLKLGSPVLFTQERPGLVNPETGEETIFKMYKFRTMTDERDENGELLPDEVRLTKFGAWLRNSSLDELPEAFNILNGTMSVIGPRPQLVRDMVFMTPEQRARHTAKPGLSGLAQVSGRNSISWEGKLETDLKYIEKIDFLKDAKIVFQTVKKAFIEQEGADSVAEEAMDYGDYLLKKQAITKDVYLERIEKAKRLLEKNAGKDVIDNFNFSVSMCVYGGDDAQHFNTAVESVLAQTLPPDEIVLVVDGPVNDELEQVIRKYELNEKFNVIRLKKNQGHGVARKIGLDNCSNELVAIMDADDISVLDRFEKQISEFKEHPDVDVVGGIITEFVDTPSNVVGSRIVPLNDFEIKEYMKRRCPMNLVTVMFKKSTVESVGGFIDWFCEEDYYLWLRMALAKKIFKNCEDVLVNVRVGEEMYQRRGGLKYFASETKLQTYMLKKGIIGLCRYLINVSERLILQVLMPNKVRGFIFQKFARS